MKVGRNDPCPCGSGKKSKSCHGGRNAAKPREQSIVIDYGIPRAPTGLRMRRDGGVQFIEGAVTAQPEYAWAQLSYPREKKPKVVTRVPLDPAFLHPSTALGLTRYRLLLAIDTNTRVIDNDSVSVTCVLALPGEITDPKAAEIMPAIEMRNARRSPERVAWRLLTASAARWAHPTSPPSVGIIVDSELDLLSDINLRKIPVDGDFMLPEGFQLVYASADASGDARANPLIRQADNQADALFAAIAANAADRRLLEPVPNEAFSSIRWWKQNQDGVWEATAR